MTEIKVYEILYDSRVPLLDSQIAQESGLNAGNVARVLKLLEKETLVQRAKGGRYKVNMKTDKLLGKLDIKREGYGFLIHPDKDIFISRRDLSGAMHGDTVIAKFKKKKRGLRLEAKVVNIVERSHAEIIGRFEYEENMPVVHPSDRRIPFLVQIPSKKTAGAKEGQIVVANILNYPSKTGAFPIGEITDVLGDEWDPAIEIEIIIREHGLKKEFPSEVTDEVNKFKAPSANEMFGGRKDFRSRLTLTIDGEDAKDFDDAVSVHKSKNGFLLTVMIADVSHYVRFDRPVFEEARERGTSVYLSDRVIPMLPKRLSNNICSLVPDEDRLCVAAEMLIGFDGEVIENTFHAGIMKSDMRLTYEGVDEFFDSRHSGFGPKIEKMLLELKELSEVLEKKRLKRGSLDFESVEPRIILENGRPVEIKTIVETPARKLIEEAMIVTNETVASFLREAAELSIYRIHQEPDPVVLSQLAAIMKTMDYDMPETPTIYDLQQVISFSKDMPEKILVSTLLLRSMQQARYSSSFHGHYGLASECYTHFTSPIRRFPDLLVHMLLKHFIGFENLSDNLDHLYLQLGAMSEHSSVMEREAMDAERESVDAKICEYMSSRIGEEFDGIISGVTPFGFFVELDNASEGLVHISSLTDDVYRPDGHGFTLLGARTGKAFRLGQQVRVVLKKARIGERKIDFELT